ncbi:hypothetical protein E4U42_001856 [Claviceps africana]|uniref:DUF4470 domain-containing protein n=1 Tax=Claviceps africana TaxID=83212 RepID=A0A8K0JE98_9HYPO|nr:hypothetical protein E4U42_001856 [Claviceps africana]
MSHGCETSAEAKALGNDLYRAGRLLGGIENFRALHGMKFNDLVKRRKPPDDPSSFSNLSAVSYEIGDYGGAIAYIRQALLLSSSESHENGDGDKLYSRMAKCFLYLRDLTSAKDAISSIKNDDMCNQLTTSVELMDAFCDKAADESVLRKQILDHDVSLLFAGCGDGRNAFSAILNLHHKDEATRGQAFKNLYLTLIDLKPAALAKVLVFSSLMIECSIVRMKYSAQAGQDCALDMANLFSCHIIPPFAAARLQGTINRLLEKLDGNPDKESGPLDFLYVPESDRLPLLRALRQWQLPWSGLSKVSDMRSVVKREHQRRRFRAQADHGIDKQEHGSGSQRSDFENFATILPSGAIAERREASLAKPLALHCNDRRATAKNYYNISIPTGRSTILSLTMTVLTVIENRALTMLAHSSPNPWK